MWLSGEGETQNLKKKEEESLVRSTNTLRDGKYSVLVHACDCYTLAGRLSRELAKKGTCKCDKQHTIATKSLQWNLDHTTFVTSDSKLLTQSPFMYRVRRKRKPLCQCLVHSTAFCACHQRVLMAVGKSEQGRKGTALSNLKEVKC